MSLSEIREAAGRWSAERVPWGEAVLIRVRRSAPRTPGARFAAAGDGSVAGTISAGCVEADLREHILEALARGEPRRVEYGISDEMAAGVGLSCGGEIDVVVWGHDPEDTVWDRLADMLDRDEGGLLCTGASGARLGRQLLIRPDGSSVGTLGSPEVDKTCATEATSSLAREDARIHVLADGSEVFLESIVPPRHLVVVGATPVAEALTRMASLTGFRITIVDPREGLARTERFPQARVIREWPTEGLAAAGLDRWTDVAVLSHEARLDVPALEAALQAGCGYVGLLGGGRTQQTRREALAAAGVSAEDLGRVRGPIGLDLGARTPAEIAVAVLAEIIAARRGEPLTGSSLGP